MRSQFLNLLIFLFLLQIASPAFGIPGYCGDGRRDPGEECDVGIFNGLSSSCCTIDCLLRPTNWTCRNATLVCDVPETCDHLSGVCPPDAVQPSTYECITSGGNQCKSDETCDGVTKNCPDNNFALGTSCNSDDNACTLDTCDGSGNCVSGLAINYDDGQFCNGEETCDPVTGAVVPGTPIDCDDGNSCTLDFCDDNWNQCFNLPMDGTFGPCGVLDTGACTFGTLQCNGTDLLADITCVGAVLPVAEICDDGLDNDCDGLIDNGCGVTSACETDADCSSYPKGQCEDIFCDVRTYTCLSQPKVDYTPCDDSLSCTVNDMCAEGICLGTPIVCDDNNECTYDTCSEPDGLCSYDAEMMYHSPCDADGDYCSLDDVCDNQGHCIPGALLICPTPENPCMKSSCNPEDGSCIETPITGSCDDGNACTHFDQCINGTCTGVATVCDDLIPCVTQACDSEDGICEFTVNPGSCFIEGHCYSDGDFNPNNPCQVCNSTRSTQDWSWVAYGGVPCNDDEACTVNDTCNPITGQCEGEYIDCSYLDSQCTVGACDGGCCVSNSANDESSCDDSNPCTTGEFCTNSICGTGEPVDCSYLIVDSQCQYVGCDPEGAGCFLSNEVDGTACVLDSDVCSTGHPTCQSGVCTAGDLPTCKADTQCAYYLCDDPLNGCTFHLRGSGVDCSPGTVCRQNGTCSDSSDDCIAGPIVSCSDDDPCTNDYCDAVTGCYSVSIPDCLVCSTDADCAASVCYTGHCVGNQCYFNLKEAGTSCSDNNVCNGLETCDNAGFCQPGLTLACNDGNACTDDTCDSITGCQYTNNDTNSCNDRQGCTTNDHCSSGVCVSDPVTACSDLDYQCGTYYCVSIDPNDYSCTFVPAIGDPCDDENACTTDDICDDHGQCQGFPLSKPVPPDECTTDYTCVDGDWIPSYATLGTNCSGSDLCWKWTCGDSDGVCSRERASDCLLSTWSDLSIDGNDITCVSPDQCINDALCNPDNGLCEFTVKSDDTPCDDGDVCTQSDTCQSGSCLGSNHYSCTPIDQCHDAGTCYDNEGSPACTTPNRPDYSLCDDGDVCTTSDVCIDGTCVGTSPQDCSSPNPCLLTSCDPILGCQTSYNDDAPCDDGNACTEGTYCVSGACPSGSGSLITCELVDACNAVTCSAASGCVYSPNTECHTCSVDGDCPNIPCQSATCSGGTCTYSVDDENIVGCLTSQYCTGIETCSNGVCYDGTPPDCDDGNECTLDVCNYTLSACTHTANTGTTCTSDNMCAIHSVCDSNGVCQDQTFVSCDAAPQCWASIGCDPDVGVCVYHKLFDNSPCNDGNPCTNTDICSSGTCIGTAPTDCPATDECHTTGTCDIFTGECLYPTKADGTPCDDNLFCTTTDTCFQGICGGLSNECKEFTFDHQCQYVTCDEDLNQCILHNHSNGVFCDTGNSLGICSTQDICIDGACVDQYTIGVECRSPMEECDAAEFCEAADDCPPDLAVSDGTPCDQEVTCTTSECTDGVCTVVSSFDCSVYADQCNTATCDEGLGQCVITPVDDHTSCSTGGDLSPCIAFEECIGGTCSPHYATSFVGCEDGNLCTVNDHCEGTANVCISGTTKDCTDFNDLCTEGACDIETGDCYGSPLHDGIACNADSLFCTVNDTCISGVCIAGPVKDCSSMNNICGEGMCVEAFPEGNCVFNFTDPSCNPDHCSGGCTHTITWWKQFNSEALDPNNRVAWPGGTELNVICGKTWLQWSRMRSKGIAWRKLFEQYLSAQLNIQAGACIPGDFDNLLQLALDLLNQCKIDLSVYRREADPYKDYTVTISSYNGGLTGPGNCIDESCASNFGDTDPCLTQTNSFYTRKIQRSIDFDESDPDYHSNQFISEFTSPEDCVHGAWDSFNNKCQCFYGWSGSYCDACAVDDSSDKVFLCVPTRLDTPRYLLRHIPRDELEKYLPSNDTLPFVSIPEYPAVYPGENGLDCFCSEQQTLSARDLNLEVTSPNDDLLLYITIAEAQLGVCEITWNATNNLSVASYVDFSVQSRTLDDDDGDELTEPKIWKTRFYILLGFFIFIAAVLVIIIFHKLSTMSSSSSSSSKKEARVESRLSQDGTPKFEHNARGASTPDSLLKFRLTAPPPKEHPL